jgi:hypothetical protein
MWVFDSKQRLQLVTLRAIHRGEEITVSYVNMLDVPTYNSYGKLRLKDALAGKSCQCGSIRCILKPEQKDIIVYTGQWSDALENGDPDRILAEMHFLSWCRRLQGNEHKRQGRTPPKTRLEHETKCVQLLVLLSEAIGNRGYEVFYDRSSKFDNFSNNFDAFTHTLEDLFSIYDNASSPVSQFMLPESFLRIAMLRRTLCLRVDSADPNEERIDNVVMKIITLA